MKVKAFALSAIYIGVAGVLNVGMAGYTYPGDYNADISVRFFMMLLVGGVGSIPGCILGALAVTVLPEILRFAEDYYLLAFYLIVFIMARVLPYGPGLPAGRAAEEDLRTAKTGKGMMGCRSWK